MENSRIEWCDHTFNPWEGCAKVSPGCANCYAAARNHRYGMDNWGKGKPRRRTSAANWRLPVKWNRAWQELLDDPDTQRFISAGLLRMQRPRVFCASLADWLDEEVPIEWLADLLKLIHDTPNLDWLLLTKRPENFISRFQLALTNYEGLRIEGGFDQWLTRWFNGEPPSNVWIGTTVEDQQRADERIPELLKIPAKVRFLSCEPLLGPVDLSPFHIGWFRCFACGEAKDPNEELPLGSEAWCSDCLNALEIDGHNLHWVICGGESGPKARPMHPDWARSLRDQCVAAGVPFFFKQWGKWIPVNQSISGQSIGPSDLYPGAKSTVIQLDGTEEFAFPPGAMTCLSVGKKAAGRLLDGREWNKFPEVGMADGRSKMADGREGKTK